MRPKIAIVGGGVSGIAAARTLSQKQLPFSLFEKNATLGGRVSSRKNGFICDEGFQVLLSSYPIVQEFLSEAYVCGAFESAALAVLESGEQHIFANPIHHPNLFLRSLFEGSTKPRDLWASLKFFKPFLFSQKTSNDLLTLYPNRSSKALLESFRFSQPYFQEFLLPFFQGIMLDKELENPAGFLLYLQSLFFKGKAMLPRGGMGQFIEFLSKDIPGEFIHLNANPSEVLNSEDPKESRAKEFDWIIDARSNNSQAQWKSTRGYYFQVDAYPNRSRCIHFFPSDKNIIQSVCFPSAVEQSYAPDNKKLMLVSLKPWTQIDSEEKALETAIHEINSAFPNLNPTYLSGFKLARALPILPRVKAKGYRQQSNTFDVGDAWAHPSLQGAYDSGEAAAHQILKSLDLMR